MFKSIHILYPVFYVFCWRVIQKYSEKARCGHTTAFVRRPYILKKIFILFWQILLFSSYFCRLVFFFLLFFRMTNIMSSILFSVFLYYYCVFLVCLLLELSFICSIISYGVPETLSYPQDKGILKGMTSFLIILLFVW